MNLRIKDSVIHPNHLESFFVRESEQVARYKVYLSLEGPDLPYVDSVIYYLHDSFQEPVRHTKRTIKNTNCELAIWTWGLFTVRARVKLKDGNTYLLPPHRLSYDKEIKSKNLHRKIA